MAGLSPMMEQYFQIKQNYADTLLFFRLGDFYEMFFEDAKIASKELELVLTGRDCGQEERAPMCGVPFHSADSYIAKLVSRGYKVAICEQVEDPATAKGIVKRDVVRIVTPGTVIESSMLDEGKNNFLASVYITDKSCGAAFVDVSTGEVHLDSFNDGSDAARLMNQLGCFNPSEVLLNKYASSIKETAFACHFEIMPHPTIPKPYFSFFIIRIIPHYMSRKKDCKGKNSIFCPEIFFYHFCSPLFDFYMLFCYT